MIKSLAYQLDTLRSQLKGQQIAVAVSGGSDSMALCFIVQEWAKINGFKVTALTIDHQLRPTSLEEAQQVRAWLTSVGIHHEILTWQHDNVISRIQEHARDARYKLLMNYCVQHNIFNLFLGHHLHDQHETFMMRLSHASGLKGLVGMSNVTPRKEITIFRPFLTIEPKILKTYLSTRNQSWIEDPSNQMEHYERIRWRNQLSTLSDLSLSPAIISNVCNKLRLENEALEWTSRQWVQDHTHWDDELKFIQCDMDLKNLPEALVKRVMFLIASRVRETELTTADVRHNLNAPYHLLRQLPFKSFTFGGCYWMEHQNSIYIVREWGKCPTIPAITTASSLYDNRFLLTDLPLGCIIHPVGKNYWPLIKPFVNKTNLPYHVFLSLPIVFEANKLKNLSLYESL